MAVKSTCLATSHCAVCTTGSVIRVNPSVIVQVSARWQEFSKTHRLSRQEGRRAELLARTRLVRREHIDRAAPLCGLMPV